MSMFVKSKFGGSSKEYKKPIGLDDGQSLVFRFVPPLAKFNMDENGWAVYHRVHWGYKGSDRKKPGSSQPRTFRCTLEIDYKSKRVKTPCGEHAKIEEQEQLLKDKEAIFKAQGLGADEIKEMLEPLREWLKAHNVDAKWYANVITEASKLEVLRFPHKGKQAIEKAIKEYREGMKKKLVAQGKDPSEADQWDPNDPTAGCYFKLTRNGSGSQTEYSAVIVEDMVPVKLQDGSEIAVPKLKLAPMTVDHEKLVENEAADLTNIVRVLSPEQIDRLVACSGSPEEVDAIFGQGEKAPEKTSRPATYEATQAAAAQKVEQTKAAAETVTMVSVPATAPAATTTAPAATTTETAAPATAPVEDEESALMARLAALQAKKAAATSAPAPAATAPATTPPPAAAEKAPASTEPKPDLKTVKKMDDKSFLNLFGKPGAKTPATTEVKQ